LVNLDVRKSVKQCFHIFKLEMRAAWVAAWNWITSFAVDGALQNGAETATAITVFIAWHVPQIIGILEANNAVQRGLGGLGHVVLLGAGKERNATEECMIAAL
jgi:hypothetical protein